MNARRDERAYLWSVSEEQRSSRSKASSLSLWERAERFWAATASQIAYIAQLCCALCSLFRSKIGPASADIIYAGLNSRDKAQKAQIVREVFYG